MAKNCKNKKTALKEAVFAFYRLFLIYGGLIEMLAQHVIHNGPVLVSV
jgi:hypothetical protein